MKHKIQLIGLFILIQGITLHACCSYFPEKAKSCPLNDLPLTELVFQGKPT